MVWETYAADGGRLRIEHTALAWIVSVDGDRPFLRRSLREAVSAATEARPDAPWIRRLERQLERELESRPRRSRRTRRGG